jgi:hypothetical protein
MLTAGFLKTAVANSTAKKKPPRRFLLLLLFDLEDGGSMFLRNIHGLLPGYKALHPARYQPSVPTSQKKQFMPITRINLLMVLK